MPWIIYVLFTLKHVELSQQLITTENNVNVCVTNILKKYYTPKSELTVADLNLDNDADEIFAALHKSGHNIIYSRTTQMKNKIPFNAGYLIIANSSREFVENFDDITTEVTWHPYSKMLILVRHLNEHDLEIIFDILLSVHVVNVVLINTSSLDLFTYNPFDNYNCGRRYDRIISLGRCNQMNEDLFYEKLVTGLKNCTIRVTYSPLPPYVFDPDLTDEIGLEQFIFMHIAEKEGFVIDYRFRNDVDEFSTILNNITAVGPLRALQTNKTDVIIGSMLLTPKRGQVFTYLAENSEAIDYLTIQVAAARQVSILKNFFFEFPGLVWLALILVFAAFSLLIFVTMRDAFGCVVLLKLFGFLLLQGNNITGNSRSNSILMFWMFFAYIINCYYQSSLVSLMANPYMEYQISNEADISSYNLKPCISKSVRRIMRAVDAQRFAPNEDQRCGKSIEDSVRIVAEKRNTYTISLQSVYEYHETNFYDEDGDLAVYTFQSPISQVIYACYMYKGFPRIDRIQLHYLRLGEAGLISQQFEKLKTEKKKQYGAFKIKNRSMKVIIPWAVLWAGVALSLIAFGAELLIPKFQRCSIIRARIFEYV